MPVFGILHNQIVVGIIVKELLFVSLMCLIYFVIG